MVVILTKKERNAIKEKILRDIEANELASWVLYRLAMKEGLNEMEYANAMENKQLEYENRDY
jgi:hypothetical protein